jgi:hypothetical protein
MQRFNVFKHYRKNNKYSASLFCRLPVAGRRSPPAWLTPVRQGRRIFPSINHLFITDLPVLVKILFISL